MRINEDCIRDTLKYLIETLEIIVMDNEYYRYDIIDAVNLFSELQKYKRNDILYSLKILYENNFIRGYNLETNINAQDYNNIVVFDVTYKGHQFYESIQPEDVWIKTKNIISKVGSHALNFVEQTAQMIATESAKQAVTIMMTNKK